MERKHFWLSKTFWVNVLAITAIFVQYFTGNEIIDAEAQGVLLAVLNLILRIVTKQPISW